MVGGNHWRSEDYTWSPETLVATRISGRKHTLRALDVPHSCEEVGAYPSHRKGGSRRRGKSVPTSCQVDGCTNKCEGTYYKKYRVCEEHGKSPAVCINGQATRFCQKCARFQSLDSFDGEHRSCRVALDHHNERRRQAKAKSKGRGKSKAVAKKGVEAVMPDPELMELNCMADVLHQTQNSTASHEDAETADDAYLSLMSTDMCMDIDEYCPEQREIQLAIKFQDGTPSDLPESLYDDLLLEVPAATDIVGAIRPGCTYLTTSIRVSNQIGDKFISSTSPYDLARRFHKKWSQSKSLSKGFEVRIEQQGAQVTSDGSHVMNRQSLPPLVSLIPCCVSSMEKACLVDVIGQDIKGPKVVAMCRQNGRYKTTTMLLDEKWEDSEFAHVPRSYMSEDETSQGSESVGTSLESRGSSSMCVTDGFDKYDESDFGSEGCDSTEERHQREKRSIKILGLEAGVCEIEFVHENNTTPPLALLILPDADAVEAVQKRITSHQHKPWAQAFLRDVGFVMHHLYGEASCAPEKMALVRKTAHSLESYCWKNDMHALASFLESAMKKCAATEETKSHMHVQELSYSATLEYLKLADAKKLLNEVMNLTGIARSRIDSGWRGLEEQILYGAGMLFAAILVCVSSMG